MLPCRDGPKPVPRSAHTGAFSSDLQLNEHGGRPSSSKSADCTSSTFLPAPLSPLTATQHQTETQLGLTTAVPVLSNRASPCLTEWCAGHIRPPPPLQRCAKATGCYGVYCARPPTWNPPLAYGLCATSYLSKYRPHAVAQWSGWPVHASRRGLFGCITNRCSAVWPTPGHGMAPSPPKRDLVSAAMRGCHPRREGRGWRRAGRRQGERRRRPTEIAAACFVPQYPLHPRVCVRVLRTQQLIVSTAVSLPQSHSMALPICSSM